MKTRKCTKIMKIKNMRRILDYFGSVINLSKHLGISPDAIYQWKKVPKIRAYQIEIITEGEIKSSSLI